MPTLAELQELYAVYNAAELALLSGKIASYTIGSQQYTYLDLAKIQSGKRSVAQQIASHPDNTATGGRLSHGRTVFGGRS